MKNKIDDFIWLLIVVVLLKLIIENILHIIDLR